MFKMIFVTTMSSTLQSIYDICLLQYFATKAPIYIILALLKKMLEINIRKG